MANVTRGEIRNDFASEKHNNQPPPKKNIKSKYHKSLAGGWATPLKNMMKVSWDEEIPNWMETHVPNHQPDAYTLYITMENHNF